MMDYWILFANISLKIFALMFISEIVFSFIEQYLSGFGINVKFAL